MRVYFVNVLWKHPVYKFIYLLGVFKSILYIFNLIFKILNILRIQ